MGNTAIYVSWGGAGRAAEFRQALQQVSGNGEGVERLVYLAVIGQSAFPSLDSNMVEIVTAELEWLLQTQTSLSVQQLGLDTIEVEVWVRHGDLVTETVDAINDLAATHVLLGQPLEAEAQPTIAELLIALGQQTKAEVTVMGSSSQRS